MVELTTRKLQELLIFCSPAYNIMHMVMDVLSRDVVVVGNLGEGGFKPPGKQSSGSICEHGS